MRFNEQVTIENYIIKFIKDKLGFEFTKYRELETEYIITPLLERAISALNPTANESEIKSVIREVRKIDANDDFLKTLREGVNLMNTETRQMQDYKLIDFINPANNQFVVTNQFYFEGDTENIRTD